MHAKMDGNQDVVISEEVHLLSPTSDRLVTSGHQLRVEKRIETVHFGHIVLNTALH